MYIRAIEMSRTIEIDDEFSYIAFFFRQGRKNEKESEREREKENDFIQITKNNSEYSRLTYAPFHKLIQNNTSFFRSPPPPLVSRIFSVTQFRSLKLNELPLGQRLVWTTSPRAPRFPSSLYTLRGSYHSDAFVLERVDEKRTLLLCATRWRKFTSSDSTYSTDVTSFILFFC